MVPAGLIGPLWSIRPIGLIGADRGRYGPIGVDWARLGPEASVYQGIIDGLGHETIIERIIRLANSLIIMV